MLRPLPFLLPGLLLLLPLAGPQTELFEKLMASESLKGRAEEARLQRDLAAMQVGRAVGGKSAGGGGGRKAHMQQGMGGEGRAGACCAVQP